MSLVPRAWALVSRFFGGVILSISKQDVSKKVAAVVVTYNRKHLLAECINCLLSQEALDSMDIIVIDNASTDGTRKMLEDVFSHSDLIYINTEANLGGAGGFSRGMYEATIRGYGWVWVMDDDCMPDKKALSAFLQQDQNLRERYGFFCSKVLWRDGSLSRMNIPRKSVYKPLKVDMAKDAISRVAMASFVSLFVPCNNIVQFGLPIKEFFIWTDDWEFTRRLSRKLPCYFIPQSVVTHKSKSNIGANIATEDVSRLNRFNYLYRNDVYLYRREGIKGFFYEIARILLHSVRVLAFAPNNKLKRLQTIYSGTIRGISFSPSIEFVYKNGNATY